MRLQQPLVFAKRRPRAEVRHAKFRFPDAADRYEIYAVGRPDQVVRGNHVGRPESDRPTSLGAMRNLAAQRIRPAKQLRSLVDAPRTKALPDPGTTHRPLAFTEKLHGNDLESGLTG